MKWGRLLLFCVYTFILFIITPLMQIFLHTPNVFVASRGLPLKYAKYTRGSSAQFSKSRRLLVLIVQGLNPKSDEGLFWTPAVFPVRAGRVGENWNLLDVISTGSRSPNNVARLGSLLQQNKVRVQAYGTQAARMLNVPDQGVINARALLLSMENMSGDQNGLTCADVSKKDVHFIQEKYYEGNQKDFITVVIGVPEGDEKFGMLFVSTHVPPNELLSSPSTRNRPGLVAATDIGTTILGFFTDTNELGAGKNIEKRTWDYWRFETTDKYIHRQVEVWEAQHRAQKYLKFVPWALAGLFLLSAWRCWKWLRHFAMVYPLGLLLMPLFGVREAWIYLGAALIAGGIAAAGEQGIKGAAWATIGVVLIDVALGGWVSARTPLSYSPIEAARFYGIGNEMEGYLIGAALIAGAGDIAMTALLGIVVSLVLGAPMLGADFGGFLTSIVTFSVAILVQIKKKWRVSAAILLIVLAVAGTFLLVRSSAGNHVGRVTSGGGEGRMTVLVRKLAMNTHLTLTSPWALLALVQIVLLWRQKKNVGLLTGAGTVWGLNDSGVVAAALLLLWHGKAPDTARVSGAASEVA